MFKRENITFSRVCEQKHNLKSPEFRGLTDIIPVYHENGFMSDFKTLLFPRRPRASDKKLLIAKRGHPSEFKSNSNIVIAFLR